LPTRVPTTGVNVKIGANTKYGLSRGGHQWAFIPNCKKHLKGSTEVDAEYNSPTGVPKIRVDMTKRRIPGVDLRVHHVLTTCRAQTPYLSIYSFFRVGSPYPLLLLRSTTICRHSRFRIFQTYTDGWCFPSLLGVRLSP
jgi:hypothetical protein